MKQPVRILIVEDEVLTAMSMEMELKQAGYDVCKRVVTGEEAITSAEQDHPDLIVMDIRLAGSLDGIEAAQQICSRSNIPIIFITGYLDKDFKERAKQLHPIGYFIKPVSIHILKTAINSAFT